MAAGADDRYFYHNGRPRAGQLQTLQDLANADRITDASLWVGVYPRLTDEMIDWVAESITEFVRRG